MSNLYERQLRDAAYDDVVVSAHFDDAVFSLGGSMAAWRSAGRKVLVITVFGHGKSEPPSKRGMFGNYAAREREDRAAMAALDVDYVWLNQPELLFRKAGLRDFLRYGLPFASLCKTSGFCSMFSALLATLDDVAPHAELHFPLAVGSHPDHRLLFDAGQTLAATRPVHFYEDIPYSFFPSFVPLRLAYLMGTESPSVRDAARDLSAISNRGVVRLITFLPAAAYLGLVALAFGARRVFHRRWQTLVREERVIASFLSQKARAMGAYTSQVGLFFASPETIERELTSREAVVERSWRFA